MTFDLARLSTHLFLFRELTLTSADNTVDVDGVTSLLRMTQSGIERIMWVEVRTRPTASTMDAESDVTLNWKMGSTRLTRSGLQRCDVIPHFFLP